MKLVFEATGLKQIKDQIQEFLDELNVSMIAESPPLAPPADTSVEQTQPADTSVEVSTDELIQALRAHVALHGKDSAMNILAEFGAPRASEIKAEDRAAALEKLNG